MGYNETELREARSGQRFVGIMFGLCLALLLSSCGAYWVEDRPGYNAPVEVREVRTQVELFELCGRPGYALGRTLHGCAWRFDGLCLIYIGPKADACTLRHELKHCRGWTHDDRPTASPDCGD